MSNERDYLRDQLKPRLKEYVERITTADRGAGQNMYRCPLCGSGSHGGVKSDGAFSVTKDGLTWHCFACQKGGDLFDLIGEYEGIDSYSERVKFAEEMFGAGSGVKYPAPPKVKKKQPPRPKKQYLEYVSKCHQSASGTDYLKNRGFTPETISRFCLGYDPQKNAIVIPYDRVGSYYLTRSVTEKVFRKPPSEEAGEEPVFNGAALYSEEPCFVCESPLDAISIMQAGGTAVAMGGTGFHKLLGEIEEKRPARTLILCFDNDSAGKKASQGAADALRERGISFVTAVFAYDQYSGPRKDANDLLRANADQLADDVRMNVKKALRKSTFVPYRVSDYLKTGGYDSDIAYFKKYKDRKTGFPNLDKHLTLYPGMAALGGSASLGKSTFAVNLADNLAERGETVIYFALEQDPIELVTKILARRMFQVDPAAKITNIDIKNGAKSPALDAVIQEYETIADRIIIARCNFTTTADDIREYVEDYIQRTGERPVVIVDYLQLISPPQDFKGDTRSATDYAVKALKSMQLDNELLVILISNFNRSSYAMPVSYESFKETGMIEFTCDYVWGLQLSIMEDSNFFSTPGKNGGEKETTQTSKRNAVYAANKQNPKEVEFVSLKSRNGKQVFKAFFKYYMQFDSFEPDNYSVYDEDREEEASKEAPVLPDAPPIFDGVPVR